MEMWFSEFHTPDVKHSIRVHRHLYSQKSDYQQIDIFDTPEFGRVLALNGNVMLTERDEFIYDEMITHEIGCFSDWSGRRRSGAGTGSLRADQAH